MYTHSVLYVRRQMASRRAFFGTYVFFLCSSIYSKPDSARLSGSSLRCFSPSSLAGRQVPRPSARSIGRQAAHPPHRANPAVGNGEDGRAATTETRRQGKDRTLHPRRHARSGDIRESEELSHAFVSRRD